MSLITKRRLVASPALALVALVGFTGVASADGTPGTWTAYPGQSASYSAAVQQPINADGQSNFKANGKTVIPVKFALSQATGPFVFESITNDAPTANDYSAVSFTPSSPLLFNQITELSADYDFTLGDCHLGALRWSVRLATGSVFIYYGGHPNFDDCTTNSQSGTNMITLDDLRFDTSQVGGTFYDDYEGAIALVGSQPIVKASLVLDGGGQRLTLGSATVNGNTFTPQAGSAGTPVTPTEQATIKITKVDGAPSGDVNEPITIQPQDSNGTFRIVDSKYMYNLATSSLSGVGTYTVSATIGGTTFPVGTFDLK